MDRPTGQARYLADDLPATPSQHRNLAVLCAQWLGLGTVDTALDATVAAARIRLALARDGAAPATATPAALAARGMEVDVTPAEPR